MYLASKRRGVPDHLARRAVWTFLGLRGVLSAATRRRRRREKEIIIDINRRDLNLILFCGD